MGRPLTSSSPLITCSSSDLSLRSNLPVAVATATFSVDKAAGSAMRDPHAERGRVSTALNRTYSGTYATSIG